VNRLAAARAEFLRRKFRVLWSATDELRVGLSRITSESLQADSLIFDRIRCFPTLARDHLCKIFHYASMGASSVVNAKRNDQYAQIFFRNCAESRLPPSQKSLFHRIFCNHDNACTNLVARRVHAAMMTTVVTQMRRRLSQLARVHVSLSGNAVFFAVL
jgi:hypothetical protein